MQPQRQTLLPLTTLRLILFPMLATVATLRFYLHLVRVQHVYPGGYLVHHLFTGVLILIPAAFLLAFGTKYRWLVVATTIALGIGSGLILDEIVYLVATKASDNDYVSRLSLSGAAVFIGLAAVLLLGIYRKARKNWGSGS
jgi:hypothetical protein